MAAVMKSMMIFMILIVGAFTAEIPRQERRLDHQSRDQDVVFTDVKIVESSSGRVEEEEVSVEIRNYDNNDSKRKRRPVLSKHRGLVPQLWKNYTGPEEPPAENVTCDVAQMKCSYRSGCELALQNYMLGCMDLASGNSKVCNSHCRHSLIALMSTHEGKRLMKVRNMSHILLCTKLKIYCPEKKQQILRVTKIIFGSMAGAGRPAP